MITINQCFSNTRKFGEIKYPEISGSPEKNTAINIIARRAYCVEVSKFDVRRRVRPSVRPYEA